MRMKGVGHSPEAWESRDPAPPAPTQPRPHLRCASGKSRSVTSLLAQGGVCRMQSLLTIDEDSHDCFGQLQRRPCAWIGARPPSLGSDGQIVQVRVCDCSGSRAQQTRTSSSVKSSRAALLAPAPLPLAPADPLAPAPAPAPPRLDTLPCIASACARLVDSARLSSGGGRTSASTGCGKMYL